MNRLYKDCPECGGSGELSVSGFNVVRGIEVETEADYTCPHCKDGKVLNVEFIKWMVDLAEGFEISDFGNVALDYKGVYHEVLNIEISTLLLLLLQRAIEGVNREANKQPDDVDTWAINIEPCAIMAFLNFGEKCKPYSYHDYDTIDTAKIDALFYVWEATK
jgi:hypothetical protein